MESKDYCKIALLIIFDVLGNQDGDGDVKKSCRKNRVGDQVYKDNAYSCPTKLQN